MKETDPRSHRIQEEWAALLREEAELTSCIAAYQSAIAEKEGRLARVRDYMRHFRSFHFGEETAQAGSYLFEPGGTCPIPMEELGQFENYQDALRALGAASPGGYVHGRTAGQWLIDAEVLAGLSVDDARMRVSKYMGRSREWERVPEQRGWFRYLPEMGRDTVE